MGREVRMVAKDWQHPKRDNGSYVPLLGGSYSADEKEFLKIANEKGLQEAVDYMECPAKENYMPDWTENEATYYMMYEDTSEGTPISPAFETPEELAQWLTDHNASAFAGQTATYESWLRVANGGFACSAVLHHGVIENGVDALSR